MTDQDQKILQLLQSEDEAMIHLGFQLCKGLEYGKEVGEELRRKPLKCAEFGVELWYLEQVTKIELSYDDEDATIPKDIYLIKNLEELVVNHLSLATFPSQVLSLKKLKRLELGGNEIPGIPEDFGKLTHLEELVLDFNAISKLSGAIGQLVNLSSLKITSNKMATLPDEFAYLIHLKSLDLSSNDFSVFPAVLGQLPNLEFLNFNWNLCEQLPIEIAGLNHLLVLYLIIS